jgi:redox-sensitive bicupin YhaK (pirin superfamily)
VNLLVAEVKADRSVRLDLPDGYSTALYVVQGRINVNGEAASDGELALFERQGVEVAIAAAGDAIVFVMNGAPIDEPVVGYGPFVMNTTREIQQAFADYQAGRLGKIPTEVVKQS